MRNSSRPVRTQVVAYTGTAAASANGFGLPIPAGSPAGLMPVVRQIRIVANSACHYAIGPSSGLAATVSDAFLPANTIEYLTVNPGEFISAIQAATGGLVTGTAGSLWVTDMSQG